jgi:hypothetical protein
MPLISEDKCVDHFLSPASLGFPPTPLSLIANRIHAALLSRAGMAAYGQAKAIPSVPLHSGSSLFLYAEMAG